MLFIKYALLGVACLSWATHGSESGNCKCTPLDNCWPQTSTWNALNASISGQLIAVQPVAVSCYSGPFFNNDTCTEVIANWDKCAWQAEQPAGMCQESDDLACAPVVPSAGDGQTCTLGNQPVYAVNATSPDHVAAGVRFAAENNIRLVIKTTGHDFLRRSQGFGSLEIWLRYQRTGIDFQETFQSGCTASNWTGSALRIGGGYQWSDVYAKAKENNVIVVGGGAPSIGAIGGWMSGGGFGPAAHQYGIGADQVLEADVALADGSVVTVNACQNSNVYTVIRSGGPGTYGVVVSATFKAYPMAGAVGHQISFGFSPDNKSNFLEAVAAVYASFPDMLDAGYTAFAFWSLSNSSLIGDAPPGYFHNAYMINRTLADAQAAFAPVREKLASLGISSQETWATYDDYWSLFWSVAGNDDPGFPIGAIYSRFFDKPSLQNDPKKLRGMLDVVAGEPDDVALHTIECMSGGKVWEDAKDPFSGVLPAWRTSYCLHAVHRVWPLDADDAFVSEVKHDVTYVKGRAMTALAPNTGTYMNEAGREDPDWKINSYGSNYAQNLETKHAVDPDGLFYCPTCVGSDEWAEDEAGRLCRT
ncbi:hypothetical protein CKAH01_03697 [Colletotrichum kahawae]|uniref:FAD-binding PCMH-type domain-containing protein n=1 Tax=Colletotrichum kahawae TaxID=34407 RepID=A0AAD9YRL0_COLKA|nr:hypothetical protein CKAH01_03697 [Colletotrichum kahawae]